MRRWKIFYTILYGVTKRLSWIIVHCPTRRDTKCHKWLNPFSYFGLWHLMTIHIDLFSFLDPYYSDRSPLCYCIIHHYSFKWSFKKHLEHFKLEVTSALITISFLISISENHLESFGCRPRTLSVEGQIWGKKMLKSMRTFGLKTPRYASTL